MRRPGQTVDQAISSRNQIIATELEFAKQHWQSYQSQAIVEFATGIHTIMDLSSPAHTDQNGNPIVWCGLSGCPGSNVSDHSRFDLVGIEKTSDITPKIYAMEDQAIRDAYMYVTGMYNLKCNK